MAEEPKFQRSRCRLWDQFGDENLHGSLRQRGLSVTPFITREEAIAALELYAARKNSPLASQT